MKISIIHASRSRASIAHQTASKWLSLASAPSLIEYIICLDLSDPKGIEYAQYFSHSKYKKCIKDNKSAIEAFNEGAKMSTGDLIIAISDDFSCEPYWDIRLEKDIWDKEDFILKTRDGIQKTLITLPLMDRKYYDRFGYIYNPIYKHLWCDTEMTVVAHYLGRVINSTMVFEHLHHSTGKNVRDSISKKNDATHVQGKKVFNERLKKNFGIKSPLVKYSDISW